MSVGTYSLAREGDKLLSPHFRVREFACRDGADLVKIDTDLVELLERIRTATCGAVTVNSGYRTASYNQKVAGARASQHLLGRAADIQVSGASPLLVGQIAEYYLGGHGGIGVYQTFTHVDTRTARARWDQRSGREVAVSGWPGWRPKEETVMDKDKSEVFKSFTNKAIKRFQEKKVRKYRTLHIPSLDENIKIRNLDYPEIVECTEIEDENDPNAADKYTIYLAVVEPNLKEVAQEMMNQGLIQTYPEVVNIFEMSEITEIATEIMKLSGVLGNKKVTVVEELKNS